MRSRFVLALLALALASWSQIPDYPTDHGCNTSCSVHEDGWLYMTDPGGQPMYRLPLF